MTISDKFKDEVERFLAKTGMSATTLGLNALKDGKFVFHLRTGRSPSAKTMDRVSRYMESFESEAA